MRKAYLIVPLLLAIILLGCKEEEKIVPSPPTNLSLQASSDGLKVVLSWEASSDPVDGYILYFRGLNQADFQVVDTITGTSATHDPSGETGYYYVTAYTSDGGESDPSEQVTTVPVHTSPLTVYELNNPSGYSGYGWSRTSGSGATYSMVQSSSIAVTDFYVTDWDVGYTGPMDIASPDEVTNDGGNQGGVPSGNWKTTGILEISSSEFEETGILPDKADYENYAECKANTYYAIFTVDTENYAAIYLTGDVSSGSVNVESWFQLVPGLRLLKH